MMKDIQMGIKYSPYNSLSHKSFPITLEELYYTTKMATAVTSQCLEDVNIKNAGQNLN